MKHWKSTLRLFLIIACLSTTTSADLLFPYWSDNNCGTEAEVAGHLMVGVGTAGPACYWVSKTTPTTWLSVQVGSKCMSFFIAANSKASYVCSQFIKP